MLYTEYICRGGAGSQKQQAQMAGGEAYPELVGGQREQGDQRDAQDQQERHDVEPWRRGSVESPHVEGVLRPDGRFLLREHNSQPLCAYRQGTLRIIPAVTAPAETSETSQAAFCRALAF
jgi:hypothetical protein